MPLKYNTFGNSVNIKGYTSTAYIVPCDGYINFATDSIAASGFCQLTINGTLYARTFGNSNYGGFSAIFVKKGMTVLVGGNSLGLVEFYPLKQ